VRGGQKTRRVAGSLYNYSIVQQRPKQPSFSVLPICMMARRALDPLHYTKSIQNAPKHNLVLFFVLFLTCTYILAKKDLPSLKDAWKSIFLSYLIKFPCAVKYFLSGNGKMFKFRFYSNSTTHNLI
jgi:hypothetical protein